MLAKKINKAINPTDFYFCTNCENLFEHMPDRIKAYDVERLYNLSPDDYATEEELEEYVYVLYICEGGCRVAMPAGTDDDYISQMWFVDEVWYCGDCKEKYYDQEPAMECCL